VDLPTLNFSLWSIAKIFLVFAFVVYCTFAGVVVKQVQVMTQTLKSPYSAYLKMVSILHLILSLAVLVLALVIL
jgi:hypothetical protein